MSETPMDQFIVGQFVIQARERTWKDEARGGMFSIGPTTMVQRGDRSFMQEPRVIVAVDLPCIVVRELAPKYSDKLHTNIINLREFEMKVVPKEFVDAWLAGQRKEPTREA